MKRRGFIYALGGAILAGESFFAGWLTSENDDVKSWIVSLTP
jgi:hypothetical protein